MAAGDINDPLSQIPGIALADDSTDPTDLGAGYALLKFKDGQLIWLPNGGAIVRAIDNQSAGQFTALTSKASPVEADLLLIEDSEAAGAKRKATLSAVVALATPTLAPVAGARVTRTAVQSIANNSVTPVQFDGEVFDTDGYHSTTVQNTRLTVPSGKAGYYLVGACMEMDANATGIRSFGITVNGGSTIAAQQWASQSSANSPTGSFSTVLYLAESDYVEAVVYQSSGNALNLNYTVAYSPVFWLVRLGV